MKWNAKRSWMFVCLVSLVWTGVASAEDAPGTMKSGMKDAAAAAKSAGDAAEREAKGAAVDAVDAQKGTVDPAAPVILYVPPARGRAVHTAGAGTRNFSGSAVSVAVVAPSDHVALTTRSQPTLYWFVSENTDTRIDLTLTELEAIDPLLEMTVPGPVKRGIHALRLSDLGLELDADKTYNWNVALVADAKRRSNDTLAEGFIARTPVTSLLAESIEGARESYAPYALSGIWYDAMDELFGAIEKKPESRRLRRQQVALLEQAELGEVAAFAVRSER